MALYQIQNQAQSVIADKTSYTFTDYFKMNAYIEDILAYFGYVYEVANIKLPTTPIQVSSLPDLKNRISRSFSFVSFNSELARREFLIAPVIFEVANQTEAKVRIEYPLQVSDKLQGTLDYFLRLKQNFVVVEAKNEDLTKGFTQLAVELIALDQHEPETAVSLYGAVSIGTIWQFGVLDRANKKITQDLTLYRVPDELENLLQILVAVLKGEG